MSQTKMSALSQYPKKASACTELTFVCSTFFSQCFRQSRPLILWTLMTKLIERTHKKKYSMTSQVQPILKHFLACGSPTISNIQLIIHHSLFSYLPDLYNKLAELSFNVEAPQTATQIMEQINQDNAIIYISILMDHWIRTRLNCFYGECPITGCILDYTSLHLASLT